MTDKKYIVIFLTFITSSLVIIGIFDYLVNPFDIFNTVKIAGFNKNKPESDRRQRLSKAYIIEKECPENLIMGNSRALAISAHYDAWPGKSTYNYALSSANMYETYRYFQHASASCDIKTVLLSLDVLMFEKGAGAPSQFKEERLSVTKYGEKTTNRIKSYLQDSIPALISLTAFKASIRTLRKQKTMIEKTFDCSSAQKNHQRIINKGGHHEFINEENRGLFKLLSNINDTHHMRLSLNFYTQFLRRAYDNNIRLILFIPPSHATLYETIYASGYMNKFIQWKKNVVKINEDMSHALNTKAHEFFDFSGYNSITKEEIPLKAQRETGMKWFWEAIHFKEELGYHILDRIFNHKRNDCPTPHDFGVKISMKNIATYEEIQKKSRQEYVQTHIELVSNIKAWKKDKHQ